MFFIVVTPFVDVVVVEGKVPDPSAGVEEDVGRQSVLLILEKEVCGFLCPTIGRPSSRSPSVVTALIRVELASFLPWMRTVCVQSSVGAQTQIQRKMI